MEGGRWKVVTRRLLLGEAQRKGAGGHHIHLLRNTAAADCGIATDGTPDSPAFTPQPPPPPPPSLSHTPCTLQLVAAKPSQQLSARVCARAS